MRPGTAKVIDRSAFVLATICLAGNSYGVPSVQFWKTLLSGRAWVLILLLAVLGVFGALTPFQGWVERARLSRRVAVRTSMLSSFGEILKLVQRIDRPESLEINDAGLHVWKKKRTIGHPIRGVLRRIATYRLGATPMTVAFSPPQGEGVVGQCWKRNREVGFDVEALRNELKTEVQYLEFVQDRGSDDVMGLSWDAFSRVSHRGAVFASPVRNSRNSFIGCVSFDVKHGYKQLDSTEMWHLLNSLSNVVAQDRFRNA